MHFTCQKCGSINLSVSTFVDYSTHSSGSSWHWLFRCPRCGYVGEDAELDVDIEQHERERKSKVVYE